MMIKNVGILGAGQLAQMLALAAPPMGLRCHILAGVADEPAVNLGPTSIGSVNSPAVLRKFAQGLELLTFESEFIPAAYLEKNLRGFGGRIFPSLENLSRLQDRLTQKQFLTGAKIPTADFVAVSDVAELRAAAEKFKHRFVLKKRTNGYDGRGTFYGRRPKDVQRLAGLLPDQSFIAEQRIDFTRELAQVWARSADGSITHLPLVESRQVESRCDLVLGPVRHPGHSEMSRLIKKALVAIDYVGVIAFEFFDTGRKLLVNEVAPRVHNSGHYSQLAMTIDQYDLHWLCGIGAQLREPQAMAKAFGMANLIGRSDRRPEWNQNLKTQLHWYNKAENRQGRKMGHLNAVGANPAEVLKTLIADRKRFKL